MLCLLSVQQHVFQGTSVLTVGPERRGGREILYLLLSLSVPFGSYQVVQCPMLLLNCSVSPPSHYLLLL